MSTLDTGANLRAALPDHRSNDWKLPVIAQRRAREVQCAKYHAGVRCEVRFTTENPARRYCDACAVIATAIVQARYHAKAKAKRQARKAARA